MLKLGDGEGVVGHFQTLKSTFTWLGALSLFEMKDISVKLQFCSDPLFI